MSVPGKLLLSGSGDGGRQAGVGHGVRDARCGEVDCVQCQTLTVLLCGPKQESHPASSFLLFPLCCGDIHG